jgi:hypothetical protein
VATLVALVVFISSLVNLIPSFYGAVDIRMFLFASLALITIFELVRLRLLR